MIIFITKFDNLKYLGNFINPYTFLSAWGRFMGKKHDISPSSYTFLYEKRSSYLSRFFVEENPLIMNFFKYYVLHLPPTKEKAVKAFVYSILANERISIKSIAENTMLGQSKLQLDRTIKRLNSRAKEMFLYNFRSL